LTTGSGIADRGQEQPAERKTAEFAGPEFSERDADRSRKAGHRQDSELRMRASALFSGGASGPNVITRAHKVSLALSFSCK